MPPPRALGSLLRAEALLLFTISTVPLVKSSTHSRHSARPRRADGGNPFFGLNETSRCTVGSLSKSALARGCGAQAQKQRLRLDVLQHL